MSSTRERKHSHNGYNKSECKRKIDERAAVTATLRSDSRKMWKCFCVAKALFHSAIQESKWQKGQGEKCT